VENKIHGFDGIVAPKVEWRKWGKLAPILDILSL
jgi:hypothetical protein